MSGRFARLAALSWRDRFHLAGCAILLPLVHASLAVFGYARTRRLVERLSRHPAPRPADVEALADARQLARLASIAGHRGVMEATCLRQSLLLHGWLRRRGLQPVLQLGLRHDAAPFRAHAWVELEGERLLPVDAGHRPFVSRLPHPDTN